MAKQEEWQADRYRALLAQLAYALPRARTIVIGQKTIELAPAEGQLLARLLRDVKPFECWHSRVLRGRLLLCRLMSGHATNHKYIDVTPGPAYFNGTAERHPLRPITPIMNGGLPSRFVRIGGLSGYAVGKSGGSND